MVNQAFPWSTVRHDIIPIYEHRGKSSAPIYGNRRQSGSFCTCRLINSPDSRCMRTQCSYRHRCEHCGGAHPAYACYQSRGSGVPRCPKEVMPQRTRVLLSLTISCKLVEFLDSLHPVKLPAQSIVVL